MANSKATDFLTTILDIIEAAPLLYKFTNEYFDFEKTPSTRLNKAYRFEMITESVVPLSGQHVDKGKRLDLWLSYKTKASKDAVKAELIKIYDFQELVEDALLNALVNIESNMEDNVQSAFVDDFLIINIGFNFVYKRSIS